MITQAAESGISDAQYYLGKCYDNGRYVKFDREKALEWFLKAANLFHLEATYNVALYYDEHDNYEDAIMWYQKAIMLAEIEGDNEDIIEVAQESIEELKGKLHNKNRIYDSAGNGNSGAQYEIGRKHLYGWERGYPYNIIKAKEYLLKAAEQGHFQAQYELGNICLFFAGIEELRLNKRMYEKYINEALSWYDNSKEDDEKARIKSRELEYVRGNKFWQNIRSNKSDFTLEEYDEKMDSDINIKKYGHRLPENEINYLWHQYYNKLKVINCLVNCPNIKDYISRQQAFGYDVNAIMEIFKHIQIKDGWVLDYLVCRTPGFGDCKIYMRRFDALPLTTEDEYKDKLSSCNENYNKVCMFITDKTPMAYYEYSVLMKFLDGLYRFDHAWYGHDTRFIDVDYELSKCHNSCIKSADIKPRATIDNKYCTITRFFVTPGGGYGYFKQKYDKETLEIVDIENDNLNKGIVETFY